MGEQAEVTREGWKVLLGLGSGPWNEGSMSEAVAGRGDMKPEEGGSEPGTSQELLQRLRELEAENSALAQANENQRETYERCLDEVANHVVQALLNQKHDEQQRGQNPGRQNQTLSDLFQQKLQLTTGSLPQLALHPVPVLCSPPASLQLGSVEKLAPSLPLGRCALPREGGVRRAADRQPRLPVHGGAVSVLQEESPDPGGAAEAGGDGPPAVPPPCQLAPWRDPSHSPPEPGSPKFQPVPADSRSQPESPVNGEGPPAEPLATAHELWPSCLLRAQHGLEEVLKWKSEEGGDLEAEGGRPQLLPPLCCRQKSEGSSSSSSDELGELGELGPVEKGPPGEAPLSTLAETKLDLGLLLEETESYLQHFLTGGCPLNGEPAAAYQLEGSPGALGPKPGALGPKPGALGKALSRDMLTSLSVLGKYEPMKPASGLAQGSADKPAVGTAAGGQDLGPFPEPALGHQAYISICLSGDEPPEKSAKGFAQISAQGKPKLQPGPPSPGGGALPLPSPSKMLRFLKMPTPGEKPQGPNPLRLSPQLTRSSKIPCRSNNYEACPSPVLSRRASPEGPAAPACPLPPGASGQASPKAGRRLAPGWLRPPCTPRSPSAMAPRRPMTTRMSRSCRWAAWPPCWSGPRAPAPHRCEAPGQTSPTARLSCAPTPLPRRAGSRALSPRRLPAGMPGAPPGPRGLGTALGRSSRSWDTCPLRSVCRRWGS
ncbi:unnamed protein product [Eretmochelys imbricata]